MSNDDEWETEDFVDSSRLRKLEQIAERIDESTKQIEINLQRVKEFLLAEDDQEMRLSKMRSSAQWIDRSFRISKLNSPPLQDR
jgi:hypothetical protein